jgi:hypothetical protein
VEAVTAGGDSRSGRVLTHRAAQVVVHLGTGEGRVGGSDSSSDSRSHILLTHRPLFT